MHLPISSKLQRRDLPSPSPSAANSSPSGSNYAYPIMIISFVFAVALLLSGYALLRRLRAQNRKPTYIPTTFLKQKWLNWAPKKKFQPTSSDRSRDLAMTNTEYNSTNSNRNGTPAVDADGVNRHTSVRSIITLPAYSANPHDTEQVIAREGERGGMDTVVEFPETADEEEAHREEQMESLYQIRAARRREVAEREARRQERREARERGDTARLQELNRLSRSRAAAASLSNLSLNDSTPNISAATLLAEHQSRGRERRISTVAYAALGQVRHDGSRVRANSNDSERGGLLEGAAPMGEGQGRNRAISDLTQGSNLSEPMRRERSGSSALSVSTTASDLENPPLGQATPLSTHEADGNRPTSARSSDPTTSNASPTTHRLTPSESAGSDEFVEARSFLQDTEAPISSNLPTYEQLDWGDAPAYSPTGNSSDDFTRETETRPPRAPAGPIRIPSTAPRLPLLAPLPSINVQVPSEPNTPHL